MLCSFTIDKKQYQFEVEGDFFSGNDQVLFQEEETLIQKCSWKNDGFSVLQAFSDTGFKDLKANIQRILIQILIDANIEFDNAFSLEKYHHYVKTDEEHLAVISKTRFLTFKDFNIDIENLTETFSKATGRKLQLNNPLLPEDILILRISRPSSLDINPFHRDAYLDIWKDVLNTWIPISGCNEQSSLPIIPGSHFWNEKDIIRTSAKEAKINGLTYHVPAIVSNKDGLNAIRPNPQYGDALIFTPYLVHGGALNLQEDTTRISLEIRLFFDKSKNN